MSGTTGIPVKTSFSTFKKYVRQLSHQALRHYNGSALRASRRCFQHSICVRAPLFFFTAAPTTRFSLPFRALSVYPRNKNTSAVPPAFYHTLNASPRCVHVLYDVYLLLSIYAKYHTWPYVMLLSFSSTPSTVHFKSLQTLLKTLLSARGGGGGS